MAVMAVNRGKSAAAKECFKSLQKTVAAQYDVDQVDVDAGKMFNVGIPQETKLLGVIQASTAFLGQINMPTVVDTIGHKMYGGTSKPITGRKQNERFMREQSPDGNQYTIAPTDSGLSIPWTRIDQWSRFKARFLGIYAQYVRQQIALDMMTIGWHGESVANNTDIEANPLLQDVNKGWMQWMRDFLPENILKESSPGSGEVTIYGDYADYKNLDHLVYDLKQGLPEVYRERTDLVVFVGSDLIAKEAEVVSKVHGLTPTERGATKQHDLLTSFGGLPAVTPPQFPAKGVVISTYSNLSIYTQEGSWRRGIKDNDDKMQLEDKNYRGEAYVVEDETLFVGVEHKNVVLEPEAPEEPEPDANPGE